MESTSAPRPANFIKKEQDTEAPSPVFGSGKKRTIRSHGCDKSVEMKDIGHSIRNSVNKLASQIKKPLHRRNSPPLNWFPRKKTEDSFLKRKLRHLLEVGGMSSSLVETLGNANPHYTRIAREKIAAQEAARKSIEARKTAMIEASWYRILQAARIQCKIAESNLEKAEQLAMVAFEEAKLMGVMMFDRPDCSGMPCEVRSSSSSISGKFPHTVSASFETEFEVDREVSAAVRKAFIVLANSSSSNKEEFRDLLQRIRQNPDEHESAQDSLTASLQSEYDCSRNFGISHRNSMCGTVSEHREDYFLDSSDYLVNRMVDRLKELQEVELSSLATVVATCGLNAALREMQSSNDHDAQGGPQRRSNTNKFSFVSKKEDNNDMPSLDKFLVKHVSRLEREVKEAQISKKNEGFDKKAFDDQPSHMKQITTSKSASDLGSLLIKHVSKLERKIQEAKKFQKDDRVAMSGSGPFSGEKHSPNHRIAIERQTYNEEFISKMKLIKLSEDLEDHTDIEPCTLVSADEMEEGKLNSSAFISKSLAKENNLAPELRELTNNNTNELGTTDFEHASLDKILLKPVHWMEREKMQAAEKENMQLLKKMDGQFEKVKPLDEILVKHQSKLERAKMAAVQGSLDFLMPSRATDVEKIKSLREILVNPQPKLGRVQFEATQNSENSNKHANLRKKARERELQEVWGGLSLGNSLKPHLSKLERVKAAWRRAEEEEITRQRDFQE